MLGPPAGRPATSTWPNPEPRSETYATAHACIERVVGERRGHAHPERIGVTHLPVADPRRRDLAHLDEERRRSGRQRRRVGSAARRHRVEGRALLARVERRDHREDDLAVLHRAHVTSRERAAVAVAVDVEDHRTIDAARPQEVAVHRMGQPLGGHRRARGPQRLRGDLAAVERHARAGAFLVLAAEEVAVEDFEVEQGREAARRSRPESAPRSLPSVSRPAPRTIISGAIRP